MENFAEGTKQKHSATTIAEGSVGYFPKIEILRFAHNNKELFF